MTDTATLYLLLPEIVLIAAATLIYMGGAFFPRHFLPHLAAAAAIIVAAAALLLQEGRGDFPIFQARFRPYISGPLVVDQFGHLARWGILLFGLLFVMLSSDSPTVRPAAESVGSLLLIVAGLMLVATGYDLVILFLGLELVSIPTYVVLYLGRRDPHGQEATAKYFFLSILSSALLLYGFSFLYGLAGSVGGGGATRLDHLYKALHAAGPDVPAMKLAPVALLLVFAGLGFRMTCVPFHFYAPDVYQGTNNPNAGLLSTIPKIAGFVVLVRIVFASMPGQERMAWNVALVMAVATMTLGNVLALWQDNIRRLLAYSSIAHGGYILIGVAVGLAHAELDARQGALDAAHGGVHVHGIGAALFYLTVYCLATIGAFAALKYLGARDRQIDGVDELAGLGRTRPLAALALAVSMFSLAGVPPLAGFWGKFTLLLGALTVDAAPLRPWFVGLAVIGALNAAVAMAYYLRVVGVMYFRSATTVVKAEGGPGALWAMIACTLLVLGMAYPGPIIGLTDRAAQISQPVDTDMPARTAAKTRIEQPDVKR